MADPISIQDFWEENEEALASLGKEFTGALREAASDASPEFHSAVQAGLLQALLNHAIDGKGHPAIRLVVDTNVVVADAFAVASGKNSFVPRVFESPYVEVFAPRKIREEGERAIRERLPRKADPTIAKRHFESILAQFNLVDEISPGSIRTASAAIGHLDPDDIPFLAVAVDARADAIISRDMESLGAQRTVPTWRLGKGMGVVAAFEGGSLSLAISAATAELALEAVQRVTLWVAAVFAELMELLVTFLVNSAVGLARALAQLPDWAKVVILGGLVGVGLALLFSESLRNRVVSGAQRIQEALAPYLARLVEGAKGLLQAIKAVLVWAWNVLILPLGCAAIVAGGVLFKNIREMISLCESPEARQNWTPTPI